VLAEYVWQTNEKPKSVLICLVVKKTCDIVVQRNAGNVIMLFGLHNLFKFFILFYQMPFVCYIQTW